jgi:dipeptidase
MGVNEHGVAIANASVFTKVQFNKRNDGLTGMDMLRIALERSERADAALTTITKMLEQYGQDACSGYEDAGLYYSNSFIIADPRGAILLETAGRNWVAKPVTGFFTLSNCLTIDGDYEWASRGVEDFALGKGWLKPSETFSFKACYSDPGTEKKYCAAQKRAQAGTAGMERARRFTVGDGMTILRSHAAGTEEQPIPGTMKSICVHTTGHQALDQTTGSLVAELRKNKTPTVWLTGTAAPCLSVYKPFFFPGKSLLPDQFRAPGPRADASMWWQAEQLHRASLKSYIKSRALILDEMNSMQKEFLEGEQQLFAQVHVSAIFNPNYDRYSFECLQTYSQTLRRWIPKVANAPLKEHPFAPLYRIYRKKLDDAVGVKLDSTFNPV